MERCARMSDTELDAAVLDFAERFRAALDPPAQAGSHDRARRARRALRRAAAASTAHRSESILGELEARSAGGLAGGTGGRYFGYVTGGSLPAAAIVEAWTAAVDQNVGMWPLGPSAVELEQVTIGWLGELLGYPAASGYFGSGATMANTIGLAVARHWFARKHGVDVARAGRARAARVRRLRLARSCISRITRHCARSDSVRAACARSRSTSATRCASTCSPRRSSAIAPTASSRRS